MLLSEEVPQLQRYLLPDRGANPDRDRTRIDLECTDAMNGNSDQNRSAIDSGEATSPAPSSSVPAVVRRLLKHVVPGKVLREYTAYRKYGREERPSYLKVRLQDALGKIRGRRPENLPQVRSVLFVCFGNIMRSPMCEALLRRAIEQSGNSPISITSAGLNAKPGTPAHPWAVAAAQDFGISLDRHNARLLTTEMVDQADVIFAMDYQNYVQLLLRHPQVSMKVFMLSSFADKNYCETEIPDPFYRGEEETRRCYGVLNSCIQNLAAGLNPAAPAEIRQNGGPEITPKKAISVIEPR
ncbi:MAG TPA: low molecular weight protein-tyrosine-phosphatase [Terriglobales bacterium]|nr:low molecular weight protein-tyrosine-phosphatase [Terriglobales bacterium]